MGYRITCCLTCLVLAACGGGDPATDATAVSVSAGTAGTTVAPPAFASPGLGQYFDALEALREGDPARALAPLERARTLLPDDDQIALARSVTLTLLGRFPEAKPDLVRLGRLSRHAQVWNYAHSAMSGDLTGLPSVPDNMLDSYRSVACVAPGRSVPGNVLQGDHSFPTAYATFLIYDFAGPWGDRRCGNASADAPTPDVSRAAAWFARVSLTAPELQPFHLQRARTLLESGNFPAALVYAEFAAYARPGDAAATTLMALIRQRAGDHAQARQLSTRATTQDPGTAEAWLIRAAVAAGTGRREAMAHDREVAEALDETLADTWSDRLDASQSATAEPDADALADARQALAQAAAYERPDGELQALAARVHALAQPFRLHYDERFTNRLLALRLAAEDDDDASSWTALALYLAQEAKLRGEAVEPRRPTVPWRWQGSEREELETALAHADRAVARDARHVPAIMVRAEILARLDRDNEAETAARQALDIDPDDRQALTLYAMFRGRRANSLNAQAAALRMPACSSSTTTENRYDGVWEVTRRTCTQPSGADRARADQLDRLAEQLRNESRAVMAHAIEVTRGTYEGFLVQAEAALWRLDTSGAVEALRAAVTMDPNDPRAHESLVHLLPRVGAHDEAAEHQIWLNGSLETTAAPMLALARRALQAQQWERARPYLARAGTLDPEDARVPAYLAVVDEQLNRRPAAMAQFRTALAMERARLARDRTTLLPAPAEDFALFIGVASHVARNLAAAGNAEAALSLQAEIASLPDRLAGDWRAQPLYGAHLPPFEAEPANGATWIALSLLESGRLHRAAGRREDARQAFQAALALGPPIGRPNIGTGTGDSNFAADAGEPAGDALAALVQMALEDGDPALAMRLSEQTGYVKMSAASRQLMNSLATQIAKSQALAERRDAQRAQAAQPRAVAEQQAIIRDLDAARRGENPGGGNRLNGQSGLAAILRVTPELIGRWRATVRPDYQYVGENGDYVFSADGHYRFTPANGDTARTGRWGGLGNGVEAIVLLGEDGTQETIYLESAGPGRYVLTTELALTYDLTRLT
ncbi:MAG: hypothetical protein H6993_13555 [Pseudomonadales bacterium]|nr:hypothetical protein [Pseudomonadales bacterium]